MNTKNILYLNSSPVIYGAETRLLDIIERLDKNRFCAFVLTPCTGPLSKRLKELGITTLHLEYNFKITKWPISRFLHLTRDFIRLARKNKIDIIHVNLHFRMSNFWLAFLILGKPVVVHLRSHFWIEIFEKFVICRAFKVICISKAIENSFLKKRRSSFFMFQRSSRTEIIYDGIDVKRFSPKLTEGKIRRELNIDANDFLVGLIGAVDSVKGQDILVKAANIIIKKYPNTKFVMVGATYGSGSWTNEYHAEVVNLINNLNLENKVILTGFRNDIDIFMNEIDLLVQPSKREALGTSMVEAMSCGKPVIGTLIDGIPEVIGNNEGGTLLDPLTPEELAKDITFYIENPEEGRKRGAQGRERVLKMFDIYKNIERIEEIYEQALNNS